MTACTTCRNAAAVCGALCWKCRDEAIARVTFVRDINRTESGELRIERDRDRHRLPKGVRRR